MGFQKEDKEQADSEDSEQSPVTAKKGYTFVGSQAGYGWDGMKSRVAPKPRSISYINQNMTMTKTIIAPSLEWSTFLT